MGRVPVQQLPEQPLPGSVDPEAQRRPVAAHDPRPAARGAARILFYIFVIFAAYATFNEVSLLFNQYPPTPWARTISLLAVGVWSAGCLGLIHNGRRMRIVAWAAFLTQLVGICCTTILGLSSPQVAANITMWGMAGAAYWYLPMVGSLVAIGWLLWSNPRRLAGR